MSQTLNQDAHLDHLAHIDHLFKAHCPGWQLKQTQTETAQTLLKVEEILSEEGRATTT
jgi:hypothetical protein